MFRDNYPFLSHRFERDTAAYVGKFLQDKCTVVKLSGSTGTMEENKINYHLAQQWSPRQSPTARTTTFTSSTNCDMLQVYELQCPGDLISEAGNLSKKFTLNKGLPMFEIRNSNLYVLIKQEKGRDALCKSVLVERQLGHQGDID